MEKKKKGLRGQLPHTEGHTYIEQALREVAELDTITTFKRHLDRYMDWKGPAMFSSTPL